MSIDIRRLIELIGDEPTRRAFEILSREAVTPEDVITTISQTSFGFKESTGDDGEREVTLKPRGRNVENPPQPPPDDARRPYNI